MGDPFKPKTMNTPRNEATDVFSNMLKHFMQGGGAGVNGSGSELGQFVQNQFSLPGYKGKMSEGPNALETDAAARSGQQAADFSAPGGGQDQITQILHGAIQSANNAGAVNIPTVDSLTKSLTAAAQPGLQRDLGDMQEKFGLSGLGNSTSLAESGSRAISDSSAQVGGAVAALAPQLADIQSRDALGRAKLGSDAGLSAADQMSRLPAVGQSLNESALKSGEGIRQINDEGLQKQYEEFIRQNSLFPQILSFLNGTPAPQYGPSTASQVTDLGMGIAGLFA